MKKSIFLVWRYFGKESDRWTCKDLDELIDRLKEIRKLKNRGDVVIMTQEI